MYRSCGGLHLNIDFLFLFLTGEASSHNRIRVPATRTYKLGCDEFLLVLQNNECCVPDIVPQTRSLDFLNVTNFTRCPPIN